MRATPVAAPRNLARLPKHQSLQTVAATRRIVATAVEQRLKGWRTRPPRATATPSRSPPRGAICANSATSSSTSRCSGCWSRWPSGKLFGYEGNVIVIADGGAGLLLGLPGRLRLVPRGQHRRRHLAASDLPAGQRLRRQLPAERAGAEFAANVDYQTDDDLDTRHVAALPARGQPSAAPRRGPAVPAGPRLRPDVHRDLPRRADQDADRAVAARRSDHPAVLRRHPRRPAGRHLPQDRRPTQATRSRSRVCSRRPSSSTARCCPRAIPALNDPAVAIDVYRGDTGLDTGRPQSLFTLDHSMIEQKRLNRAGAGQPEGGPVDAG